MEEIKEWIDNFNFNQEVESSYLKDEILLEKYKTKNNKHIYSISTILNNPPDFYFDYLWNIDKMIDLNKNLIKNIEILEKETTYQKLQITFSFKSRNIYINEINRKDIFYYEKLKKEIFIYGKVLEYDNSVNIKGYNYIKLKKTITNQTKLLVIIDISCSIPKLLEMLPGLLVVKNILNLKNL